MPSIHEEPASRVLTQYLGRQKTAQALEFATNPETLGRIRPMTVVFADIRHFSRLAEQLSLQRLRQFLNHFVQLFTERMEATGGLVDGFMGDGALALFIGDEGPDQELSANTAAIDSAWLFAADFKALCQQGQWGFSGGVLRPGLGMGVSRGEVFHGNIGFAGRFAYSALGPAINVSQRLAADWRCGGVYFTEKVRRRLPASCVAHDMGRCRLRGMESPQQVYHLVSHTPASSRQAI